LFTRLSEQFSEEYGCDPPDVSAQEAAQLLQAPWPGNVRQLFNVAERAVLQNRHGSGTIASLLMADTDEEMKPAMTTEGKPLKEFVEAFERMLIDNTMRRHKGSIVAVMDELCLPRRTLNEKMAKYGLQRSEYL
jgi:DNA-binding NtrC family response regulator